jgi:hypothetical protein
MTERLEPKADAELEPEPTGSGEVAAASADGAEPGGTGPDNANPDGTEPDNANPDGTEPDEAHPDDADPDGTTPDGARPGDRRRLRTIPALIGAAILVAAGVFLALTGILRVVAPGPAAAQPSPTRSPSATIVSGPTPMGSAAHSSAMRRPSG